MHMIVGLGNPGSKHRNNRHNIGFMAADAIAAHHGFPQFHEKFKGLVTEGVIDGEKVLILKPETYMNASGQSVEAAAQFYKLAPADITVFYDELDLPPGKIRIKTGGGNGGHNGLRSIDPRIGTGYRRVRLGIGHPGDKNAVKHWVLGDIPKAERESTNELLALLAENVGLLLKNQENTVMNRITVATQGDGGEREARPPNPSGKPKPAQSHIRAARPKPAQAEVPKSGPLADMLAKLFGKKGD